MDTDRRHALERNDLQYFFNVKLPQWLRENSDRFLTVLVVVMLIIAAWMWYRRLTAEQVATTNNSLAEAWVMVGQLRSSAFTPVLSPEFSKDRLQRTRDIVTLADVVVDTSREPGQQSLALLARGEALLILGSLPPAALAGAEPIAGFESLDPSTYLVQAQTTFNRILSEFPSQSTAAVSALFGLATVAENQRDFNAARSWYEKIEASTDAGDSDRALAASRRRMLDQLSIPPLLAIPTPAPAPLTPSPEPAPATP
jgi:hypothetical protein